MTKILLLSNKKEEYLNKSNGIFSSMNIIKRKGYYYLGNTYRKDGCVKYKELYLGKQVPSNIEKRKELFLRECLQDSLFSKLKKIKQNYNSEWKKYPESIKKNNLLSLAINFTYNTNAIEGSKITIDETEDLVKSRISPGKSYDDIVETVKHAKLFLDLVSSKKGFGNKELLVWHKELFSETKTDIAGKYRDYLVRVGNYRAPDWQDINKLMKEFFVWLNKNGDLNAVELAARAHYKFEKIHPFGDGNGRIGRLIIANILNKNKYPILIIEYKKRKSYYKALEKDENGFVMYFMRRYLGEFKGYL